MDCSDNVPTALSIYIPGGTVLLAALLAGWLAYRAKIADFRQKWINELRQDVADLLSLASQYHRARDLIYALSDKTRATTSAQARDDSEDGDPSDEGVLRDLEHQMNPVYNRIELRINPRENPNQCQDKAFLDSLTALLRDLPVRKPDAEWSSKLNTAMAEARELLKREWEVTKILLPRDTATRLSEIQQRPRM